MLDRESIIKRFNDQFHHCEKVEETVYRFERRHRETPVAVYFLDLSDRLPAQEDFANYQDRVIGRYYFEGNKSLQWNYYLYFIMSAHGFAMPEVRVAKAWIEGDRRYARKFVIKSEEIEDALSSAVLAPTQVMHSENVLSIWTEKLETAGIYDAIVSDASRPSRIKLIEDSIAPDRNTSRALRNSRDLKSASFVRSLRLVDFRAYPCQREFDFGTVNLFVGANGSGKTSLLEALELLYCGKNKRNPGNTPTYRVCAQFQDGSLEEATDSRELQDFRDRNLAWYGVSEIRTTNLFQSFARFNFLNTDAAVSLAETAGTLKEDLSKLLVGPDASKTWQEIERMSEAVSDQLRIRQQSQAQLQSELTALNARLEEATQITPESDALGAQLAEMLKHLGWKVTLQDKEQALVILAKELPALLSVAQQATDLPWVDSPVTSSKLSDYRLSTESIVGSVELSITLLEANRLTETTITDKLARTDDARRTAQRVLKLCDARVVERAQEYSSLEELRHNYVGILANYKADMFSQLPLDILDSSLSASRDQIKKERTAAETGMFRAKDEFAKFSRLRDESVRLAQELRAIANRILHNSPSPDECPLCHSKFEAGGLAKRMTGGLNEELESMGQGLIEELRGKGEKLEEALRVEADLTWLWGFCQATSQPVSSTVRTAVAAVRRVNEELGQVKERLRALENEQGDLASQGISKGDLDVAVGHLRSLGYPLEEPFAESAQTLLSTVEDATVELVAQLQGVRVEITRSENELRAALATTEIGTNDLKRLLATTKERLSITAALHSKLQKATLSYPWPADRSISELVVEAESVRRVVTDLQRALEQERARLSSFGEWTKRKEGLEAELSQLNAPLQRLASAYATLISLKEEHSLASGVEAALRQNQAAVEAIFSRIHSPAEFRGLGSTWDTLIRKADGSEAKLTEISTGQRAAFALSVFLAQNAKLPNGAPPVILIDDPIAHIDDLNSLSFLDYLRELVLRGNRQVFFATANEKIAALFRRKFDFLGPEFCSFSLTRKGG